MPQGPRAYRRSLRRLGAPAALLPSAAMGALAWLALHDNSSSVRGIAGFLLAVLAAPGLLIAGMPLATGTAVLVAAAAASGLLWWVVGTIAARKATRRPVATWGDYWREYLWLAAGVWLGVVLSLVAVDLVLGRPFV